MNRWMPWWVVGGLFALAVGTVWLRLRIVEVTYQITQTEKMIKNVKLETENLEIEISKLKSPRHLGEIAQKKYGLRAPEAKQMIHLGRPSSL